MEVQDKSQRRFCTRCGVSVSAMQNFCRSCGAKMRRPEVREEALPTDSSDEVAEDAPVAPATVDTVESREEDQRSYSGTETAGADAGARPRSLTARFFDLPKALRVALIGVVGIVAAVFLSPLVSILFVLLAIAAFAFVVWMLFAGESLRLGGAVVGVSLVLALIFGGISDGVWGTSFLSFGGGNSERVPDVAGTDAPQQSELLYEEEADYDSLSAEEKAYLDAARDFDYRIRTLVDAQSAVLSCYPGCNAQDMMDQGSNYEESNYVYSGVGELDPPDGYEDSYQSLMLANITMFDYVRMDILAPDITYAQESVGSTVYYLNESADLLPTDAQGYYRDEASY